MAHGGWSVCDTCGRDGMHVDNDRGEVITDGAVVAVVDKGTLLLMVDARGRLTCDVCAIAYPAADVLGLCPHGSPERECLPCSLATGERPAVEDAGA